uniref:Uncharacterized protein n=1 Tax=Strongyloides venezuelensis TaxID=75913 RepID=A0A0K0F5B8_STRVS
MLKTLSWIIIRNKSYQIALKNTINAESANMSESNKLRINNVEGKREKRLFDTFNEYIGTDKLYSENLDEDNNNSGPATLTEMSYKVIWNNYIGEYLLVFEEQRSMKL